MSGIRNENIQKYLAKRNSQAGSGDINSSLPPSDKTNSAYKKGISFLRDKNHNDIYRSIEEENALAPPKEKISFLRKSSQKKPMKPKVDYTLGQSTYNETYAFSGTNTETISDMETIKLNEEPRTNVGDITEPLETLSEELIIKNAESLDDKQYRKSSFKVDFKSYYQKQAKNK